MVGIAMCIVKTSIVLICSLFFASRLLFAIEPKDNAVPKEAGVAPGAPSVARDSFLKINPTATISISTSGSIVRVRFSPDGEQLLSCDQDRHTATLWDVKSRKTVRVFNQGRANAIQDAEFLPDGRRAIFGGLNKTLWLVDLATGEKIHEFLGHGEHIWSVAISPDGKFCLSTGSDKGVHLWEVETGKELRQFVGHTDQVMTAAFSPDGKHALTGSIDKTMRLWDAQTGKELKCIDTSKGATNGSFFGGVRSVEFSPNGWKAIAGLGDEIFNMWDLETSEVVRRFQRSGSWADTVTFSPDGRKALAAHGVSMSLWDVETGKVLCYLRGHTDVVYSVAFSPDGKCAVSGSRDKTLRFWDMP